MVEIGTGCDFGLFHLARQLLQEGTLARNNHFLLHFKDSQGLFFWLQACKMARDPHGYGLGYKGCPLSYFSTTWGIAAIESPACVSTLQAESGGS